MYVILLNNDNTMSTTVSQRIMQRSKLFDTLWFLVPPTYNGYDMAACTVLLEYLLPISRKYRSEILELSTERYEGHLKYLLPVDTELTAEHGDVEVQLTFIYSDLDVNGESIQRVRKISPIMIKVLPISAWSDIIPDSALTPLDQRIIKMDAQIKAINDVNNALYETKADNLSYDKDLNELRLMAGDKPIGDKVVLDGYDGNCACDEDGLPVVDFTTVSGDVPEDPEDDSDLRDVVLF